MDNLYVRVGYTKKNKHVKNLKRVTELDIAVIDDYILNNYKLSKKQLVIKKPFGFISVDDNQYLKDKTFYLKKYDSNIDEEYNEVVKKLK